MDEKMKHKIEELARRMYYSVTNETNQYLFRTEGRTWEELEPRGGRDWWLEAAHTCIRALDTYNDPDWEPSLEVENTEEPDPEPPMPVVA
jgi:hypothetical protein